MGMILCLCAVTFQTLDLTWSAAPPMAVPMTNNSVVAMASDGATTVYSFLGLDTTKLWSGVSNRAFRWRVGTQTWTEIDPVPGPGRLASTAQVHGGRSYVFGGYTVAEDGSEKSLPDVAIYDPAAETWYAGAPIPTPVDDAVSGIWQDSLIFLVSGWHDTDNVDKVQIYDPAGDRWRQATPIPGTPVFGHSGAIAGNTIVYFDGARRNRTGPRYSLIDEAWHGAIDPADPTRIEWTRLPAHPGHLVYRGASVGIGDWIVVAGGTDNAYNYNGIGYDGNPSAPSAQVVGFHAPTRTWHLLPELAVATMDHRTIGIAGDRLFIAGGMERGQQVTAGVSVGGFR